MLKNPGTRRAKNSINLAPWVLPTLVWGLVHAVGAETYAVDLSHSSVGFSIRHLVGRTTGHFNEFSGTITYDPASPQTTAFSGIYPSQ